MWPFSKKKECQCRGCKISRDPRQGYQPCEKSHPEIKLAHHRSVMHANKVENS